MISVNTNPSYFCYLGDHVSKAFGRCKDKCKYVFTRVFMASSLIWQGRIVALLFKFEHFLPSQCLIYPVASMAYANANLLRHSLIQAITLVMPSDLDYD